MTFYQVAVKDPGSFHLVATPSLICDSLGHHGSRKTNWGQLSALLEQGSTDPEAEGDSLFIRRAT